MSIVVGLGNIGEKYKATRHNIGFDVADKLAETLNREFEPGQGAFEVCEGRYAGNELIIVKPTTYMNRSGTAVKKALAVYKKDKTECLICYDDLNLPVGRIRLRAGGSAGGHNGVSDIIEKLGSRDFPRLRVGIGSNFPKGRQVDFVLSPFDKQEAELIHKAVENAHDACLTFAKKGIEKAMNWHN